MGLLGGGDRLGGVPEAGGRRARAADSRFVSGQDSPQRRSTSDGEALLTAKHFFPRWLEPLDLMGLGNRRGVVIRNQCADSDTSPSNGHRCGFELTG